MTEDTCTGPASDAQGRLESFVGVVVANDWSVDGEPLAYCLNDTSGRTYSLVDETGLGLVARHAGCRVGILGRLGPDGRLRARACCPRRVG
ncbi:MAG: hypothetical protein Kow0062_09820 [Acidobacteriota bacterium]